MMQELKLYDPVRPQDNWTEVVQPGQFVVFHADVHTHIAKKSDGSAFTAAEESTCMVFDSLKESIGVEAVRRRGAQTSER